ncbi:MAG: MBL fold metallo-hydrolase [Ignavibacteria bacterium]|jgi:glyoxylase-like metal-dependent hydrolase (beta-lactamase superfamily II)
MKIGDYKIYSIRTGLFRLDGGAMFGIVPKPLWLRTNPADESNRIQMCANSLLLDNGKRKILIDNGIGHKMSKKLNEIYAVDYSEYTLLDSLNQLNVKPEEITDVILTHLHFDHAGGSTYCDKEKHLNVTFPNATHYVQKKHYEWALNPTERDKASFIVNNFELLVKSKILNHIDGEFKFDNSISLLPVNGHTRNMQIVRISDGTNTLLYAADLIPMSAHVPLPFIMGYDLFPLVTLEEKRKYLTEAAQKDWIIYFEHDPFTESVKVGLNDKGFFIKESFQIND